MRLGDREQVWERCLLPEHRPQRCPRQGHRVTLAPSRGCRDHRVPGQQPRYPGRRGVTATPAVPSSHRAAGPLPPAARCTAGHTQASRAGSRHPGAAGSPSTTTPLLALPGAPGRAPRPQHRSRLHRNRPHSHCPPGSRQLPPLTSLSPGPPLSSSRRVCR